MPQTPHVSFNSGFQREPPPEAFLSDKVGVSLFESSVQAFQARWDTVHNETWEEFVRLLKAGEGYTMLRAMETSFGQHIERLTPLEDAVRGRSQYFSKVLSQLDQTLSEHDESASLKDTLGDTLPEVIEVGGPLFARGWYRPVVNGHYRLRLPDMETYGVRESEATLSFGARETWEEAHQRVARKAATLASSADTYADSIQALLFRRGILREVLWRFEVVGSSGLESSPPSPSPRYTPPQLLPHRQGWFRFGQYIWNWYADCQDEGLNQSESVREICQRLGDDESLSGAIGAARLSPEEFSERKLRTVISDHNQGKLQAQDEIG